ncbi:MAG: methylmalonyl Co-A mutase-associated GTPase MeaB [bacterium]
MSALEPEAQAILDGDMRAASRLIRRVEDGDPAARPLLRALYRHGGKAQIVGLTGAPGVGKSTLSDQIVATYRSGGKRVAVLAVDPTSPFTGGAILGDRIRMSRHFTDEGVFIRSMATRGHLGGLARATGEAVQVLDAMGWEVILIETVGAGQAEVEVVHLAETVIVALAPGEGDDVQAAKAGIMEIAHIFAVNKAKREGAERTARMIEEMLNFRDESPEEYWRPPVVKTEALDGEGIDDLIRAIGERRRFLESHPAAAERVRRERARQMLTETLKTLAADRFIASREGDAEFEKILDDLADRREDPYTAAERLLKPG